MFIGEYEYRVDEKGRVPVPPKFRTEELKREGMVLSPGMEKSITLYPPSEWKKIAESLAAGPLLPSKLRKLSRAMFSTAFSVEMDGQGRIMIPTQLREHAGITGEVVITGTNAIMEIWSKEQWIAEKIDSLKEAWHNIETMERR